MGAIEHLTISLPADMVARLRERVAAGDYLDESEAIEEAIAQAEDVGLDREDEPDMSADEIAWLREEVRLSLEEYDRDSSRGMTGEEVLALLAADRAERARQTAD